MKTKMMALTVYTALFLLHGCGGGNTPSTSAPPPNPLPNVPSDTQAPTVMSMAPLNNALMINVQSNIELEFSEALDATTISRETVQLRFKTILGDSGTVPARVIYDNNTHKITINPTILGYGIKLTLTLAGIKDLAGNTLAETRYNMHTYVNPVLTQVSHHPATDATIGYSTLTYTNHLLALIVNYHDAGTDAAWGTADDLISFLQEYQYTSDNTLLNIINRSGSATVTRYTQATYDIHGNISRITRYIGTGVDGSWNTPDDVVGGYTAYRYDTRNNLLEATNFTDAGLDLAWYTTDDAFSTESIYTYDASNNRLRTLNTSAGPDGIGGTADDINAVFYTYDASGNILREVHYQNAGADTMWFTADDSVTGYATNTYNNNGQATQRVLYTTAGTDAAWFTPDDTISEYVTYSYDTQGNHIQSTGYAGRGTDGLWFTNDDVIYGYSVNTYDTFNNRIRSYQVAGGGTDGLWFTADDTRSSTSAYDTAF